MVQEYAIRDGQLVPCEEKQGLVKVFTSPDVAERNYLEHTCRISPHNISSAMDPDEIGRLEFENDHTMLLIKSPKNYSSSDNFLFKVTSVGVFVYKQELVIIMNNQETSILEGRQAFKITSLNDALLKILYGTIAHFLGHLKVISLLSDSLEHKINSSMANEHLLNMFTIEKSLIYYLNGINSNSVVMDKLKTNATRIGLSSENLALLDDIIIENNQCNKQAEIYSNILVGLDGARGAIVNNNMNQLIKRLTIVSVVFMPLNVIAGIGGMSEFSGVTDGVPKWLSYSLFALGMVGIAFLTYWILKVFMDGSTSKIKRR
jgi:magnesium transporter